MPSPLLLAVHITIALALTILVGVQCAELGRIRLRHNMELSSAAVRTIRLTLWSIPLFAVLTFATGAAVIADGAKGGPWVGAGVISTVAIGAASEWVRRRLRRPDTHAAGHGAGVLAAVQWGVPALTLAAAFLMAARPDNPLIAFVPVVLALAVTAAAYRVAFRRDGAAMVVAG
ncbi:hypothetical protein [Nocardia nova]|uniref:hypothetical protein n=1 Tax=Nocardia nova TaxID=37330 RepID=UPI0033F34C54